MENMVNIDITDVKSEIDFWNRERTLLLIFEGFIRRIWQTYGVEKVHLVKKRIYILRFRSMEKRDEI